MSRLQNAKIVMNALIIRVTVMLIVKTLMDHIFAIARLDFLVMEKSNVTR